MLLEELPKHLPKVEHLVSLMLMPLRVPLQDIECMQNGSQLKNLNPQLPWCIGEMPHRDTQ